MPKEFHRPDWFLESPSLGCMESNLTQKNLFLESWWTADDSGRGAMGARYQSLGNNPHKLRHQSQTHHESILTEILIVKLWSNPMRVSHWLNCYLLRFWSFLLLAIGLKSQEIKIFKRQMSFDGRYWWHAEKHISFSNSHLLCWNAYHVWKANNGEAFCGEGNLNHRWEGKKKKNLK